MTQRQDSRTNVAGYSLRSCILFIGIIGIHLLGGSPIAAQGNRGFVVDGEIGEEGALLLCGAQNNCVKCDLTRDLLRREIARIHPHIRIVEIVIRDRRRHEGLVRDTSKMYESYFVTNSEARRRFGDVRESVWLYLDRTGRIVARGMFESSLKKTPILDSLLRVVSAVRYKIQSDSISVIGEENRDLAEGIGAGGLMPGSDVLVLAPRDGRSIVLVDTRSGRIIHDRCPPVRMIGPLLPPGHNSTAGTKYEKFAAPITVTHAFGYAPDSVLVLMELAYTRNDSLSSTPSILLGRITARAYFRISDTTWTGFSNLENEYPALKGAGFLPWVVYEDDTLYMCHPMDVTEKDPSAITTLNALALQTGSLSRALPPERIYREYGIGVGHMCSYVAKTRAGFFAVQRHGRYLYEVYSHDTISIIGADYPEPDSGLTPPGSISPDPETFNQQAERMRTTPWPARVYGLFPISDSLLCLYASHASAGKKSQTLIPVDVTRRKRLATISHPDPDIEHMQYIGPGDRPNSIFVLLHREDRYEIRRYTFSQN